MTDKRRGALIFQHILQPGEFFYWKKHFQKDLLQPCWKGAYQRLQINPRATNYYNSLLDSHDTPNERTNPDWTCISSGDLKVKIFWNWNRRYLIRQLSQDTQNRSAGPVVKLLMMAYYFRWSPVTSILVTYWHKKCLRFFLPPSLCCSNVTLVGVQSLHLPSNMRHYNQEGLFLILRNKRPLKLENLTAYWW